MYPDTLRYTAEHEWISGDIAPGQTVRIGITDYAQDALGDIVYVDLPEVGTEVAAGEALGELESTKSVSDLYAPIAGTVTAVNVLLNDTPELCNSDPHGEGWIVELSVADDVNLDGLMESGEYESAITSG